MGARRAAPEAVIWEDSAQAAEQLTSRARGLRPAKRTWAVPDLKHSKLIPIVSWSKTGGFSGRLYTLNYQGVRPWVGLLLNILCVAYYFNILKFLCFYVILWNKIFGFTIRYIYDFFSILLYWSECDIGNGPLGVHPYGLFSRVLNYKNDLSNIDLLL